MVECLRVRILRRNGMVVFYELLPPPEQAAPEEVHAVVESVLELLRTVAVPIDAINIPEVRPESRTGERPQAFVPKMAPRKFAATLQAHLPASVEVIINRCVVYAPRPAQVRWLVHTYQKYGIHNLIVVGGESSQIRYPGPSVLETARWLSQDLRRGRHPLNGARLAAPIDYCIGGITIPTRRKPDPQRDEPNRLLQKARMGIEFFTSQVLYESRSIQELLRDYDRLCQQQGVPPRRIFLSFAPVSSAGDIRFLKWLGVVIPPEVERELLRGWLGIAWRSIRVAERILMDIMEFVERERIRVPLGLNVEHITSRNFEISAEMIDRLHEIIAGSGSRVRRSEVEAEHALQLAWLEMDDAII